eukprot:6195563-Pleurochrysis_carterae.AAC.1
MYSPPARLFAFGVGHEDDEGEGVFFSRKETHDILTVKFPASKTANALDKYIQFHSQFMRAHDRDPRPFLMVYDIGNLSMSCMDMHAISSFADEHGKHVDKYRKYLMGTVVQLENDLASFANILYSIICKVYSPVKPVRVCKTKDEANNFEVELCLAQNQ